ncbi:MAG: hypothetical protein ACOX7P_09710 [Oscillospiraceae bacterium]|jgi:hypothetical protein
MRNIFIGLMLVFIDFNLNIGSSQIGLIPDFAGYIVLAAGLREMAGESNMFAKAGPFASGMAVYTGIIYLMDLFGVSASLGVFSYFLGLISTAVSLYISYCIVLGVKDMESKYGCFLNGPSLNSAWTLLAIFSLISFLLLFIPVMGVISIIVSFVAAICFLVAFNKSKNLYYGMFG